MRIPFEALDETCVELEYSYALFQGAPFTGTAFTLRNGQLEEECDYVAGERSGAWKEYDSQGRLTSRACYLEGAPHGESEEYYCDGSLRARSVWENGTRIEQYEYAENGRMIGEYLRATGIERLWRIDGSLRQETVWSGDLRVEERFFDHSGAPTVVHRSGKWAAP